MSVESEWKFGSRSFLRTSVLIHSLDELLNHEYRRGLFLVPNRATRAVCDALYPCVFVDAQLQWPPKYFTCIVTQRLQQPFFRLCHPIYKPHENSSSITTFCICIVIDDLFCL